MISDDTQRFQKVSPGTTRASWRAMWSRCTYSKHYPRYAGRGVIICERWCSFENFLADMGERPHGKTLGRINNDGHYEPNNCAWQTPKEQNRNTSQTKLTPQIVDAICAAIAAGKFDGELAIEYGVSRETIRNIRLGITWDIAPIFRDGARKGIKLDFDDVALIRTSQSPDKEIAARFNVSRQMVSRIRLGKAWT